MRLKQLIESIGSYHTYSDLEDFEVGGITCNSKKALDNYIFVAIEGTHEDGHKFIEEAIEKGAKAVVVVQSPQSPQCPSVSISPQKISFIKVEDTRRALAQLAAQFYGNPSRKLKVVGITGTNGKTTVSYLIEALLKEVNFIPAVIGTINYHFKDKVISSRNTTPGPLELQSMLAQMLNEGINYAITEVSSHALDQERVEEINFHSAIFTNLTQDHLDYHKTLENYFQAKSKLFKNINSNSFGIINRDDEYGSRLQKLTKARVITYGIDNIADIMAKDIKFDICGTEFALLNNKKEINIRSRLIGRHNIYNILASVSWALEEGLDLSIIKSTIEKFDSIPGRLERIDFEGDFAVFVDYAHTEDALTNVIKSLRQAMSCGRIIVVFGCGGERDKTKRPKMGYAVSKLADYAIITSDNPRGEDPQEIINDILAGVRKNNYCVIPDRKEAIRESLSLAKSGDIVLLAGKGHEDYQILKDKTIHFDDREIARECLKSMIY